MDRIQQEDLDLGIIIHGGQIIQDLVVLETTQEDLEIIIHGAHKITMNKINKNKNNSRNNNKCINNSLKTKIKDNKNKNKNNSKMMMMMMMMMMLKKYQDTESKKVALKGLQGLQDQQDHRNLLKEDDLLPLNKL